jgi:hypothetical protein
MNKNIVPRDIMKLLLSIYNSVLLLNMRMNVYARRNQDLYLTAGHEEIHEKKIRTVNLKAENITLEIPNTKC